MKRLKRLVAGILDHRYVRRSDFRQFSDQYVPRSEFRELERKVNSLLKPRWQDNPHITVGAGCDIQNNVALYAVKGREIRIGRSVRLYRNAEMNGPITIGDNCFINRDFYARRGTTIGNRVSFGPFVRLITDTHEIGGPQRRAGRNVYPEISIGDGCWVGAGAIVLGGVTIGAGSIVAAGAVVDKDVAAHTVVGGIPARIIRRLDDGVDVQELNPMDIPELALPLGSATGS